MYSEMYCARELGSRARPRGTGLAFVVCGLMDHSPRWVIHTLATGIHYYTPGAALRILHIKNMGRKLAPVSREAKNMPMA